MNDELGRIEQAQARRTSIEDEIEVDLPVSATSQRALLHLKVAKAAPALLTCWRQAPSAGAWRAADCAHRANCAFCKVLSAKSCAAAAAATCALQALLTERSAMMRRCGYIQDQLSTLETKRAGVEQETRAREVGSLTAGWAPPGLCRAQAAAALVSAMPELQACGTERWLVTARPCWQLPTLC